MFNLLIYFCIVILSNNLIYCDLDENWIDPFDMSPSKDYLQYADSFSSMHAQHLDKNAEKTTNPLSELYFRRTINMLLNSVHEDYKNPDMYSGYLYFEIDAKKYNLLKSFADGTSKEDLEAIDKILAEILNKPTSEFLQNYLESWFHKFLNIVLSREGIISIVVISYTFVIYRLLRSNFYSFQMFNFIFLNIFVFDFVFTWIHLYQKATSERLAMKNKNLNIPIQCNPEQMTSWQFFTDLFTSEDKCKNYYEANIVDIFYKVSPGMVLTEMFARSIQYPAESIGKAVGQLIYGIINSVPWPLNIIILPICLFFFCQITCIILSIIFKREFKFNFLHLINFSFGGDSSRNQTKDSISGPNLEKLLDITQNHRPFVQELPIEEEKPKSKEDLKQIEDKGTQSEELEEIETETGSGDHK